MPQVTLRALGPDVDVHEGLRVITATRDVERRMPLCRLHTLHCSAHAQSGVEVCLQRSVRQAGLKPRCKNTGESTGTLRSTNGDADTSPSDGGRLPRLPGYGGVRCTVSGVTLYLRFGRLACVRLPGRRLTFALS